MKHMLDAALDARKFLGKATFEELQRDRKLGNAIVRSLEIIGEAAANVTKTTQAKYPEIEWTVIIGMRNRLIHAYFDINYHIVWQTYKVDPMSRPIFIKFKLPKYSCDFHLT